MRLSGGIVKTDAEYSGIVDNRRPGCDKDMACVMTLLNWRKPPRDDISLTRVPKKVDSMPATG
jgi:hypothetical protein